MDSIVLYSNKGMPLVNGIPASHINIFNRWLDDRWESSDIEDFADYLGNKGLSPVTINAYVSSVCKSVTSIANSTEYRDYLYSLSTEQKQLSPKEFVDEAIIRLKNKFDYNKVKRKVLRVQDEVVGDFVRLTFDEAMEFIDSPTKYSIDSDAAQTRDRAIRAFGVCTGLRAFEMAQVLYSDLMHKKGPLDGLVVQKGKGLKKRFVEYWREFNPMFAIVSEYVDKFGIQDGYLFRPFSSRIMDKLDSGCMTVRNIEYVIQDTLYKKQLSAHDMRRTFAYIAYYKFGKTVDEIQWQLGHSDPKTTRKYIGLDINDPRLNDVR